MTKKQKYARRYARHGWAVVPMHTAADGQCSCRTGKNCNRIGKHPSTPHGVHDATSDRMAVQDYWSKHPKMNVGIACGRASSIVVLDVDPRNGGNDTLRKLEQDLGPLPPTPTALTGGGGWHYVFRRPNFEVRKDSAGQLLGPGVDILSDGAIMIAPPSVHQSGRRYRWVEGKSFAEIEPSSLPESWLRRLNRKATDLAANAAPNAVDGGRNTALTSLAGTMRRAGFSKSAIMAALMEENRAKFSSPLDAGEVKKIAASVSKYAPEAERSDDAEKFATIVISGHFHAGKHLLYAPDGNFWHYTGKLWERASDQWINGRILQSIQSGGIRTTQRTASLISQVRQLLMAKLAPQEDPLRFLAEPPQVINCTNGEVWIQDDGTPDLRPHRSRSYLRHCLDITFDPDAKCPEYDEAVLGIFANSDDPKAMRRHWNELLGYLIQPRRNNPLILILLGGGDNGKTVLTRTLIKLIGSSLVQAQRVEDLAKSRFAFGSLLGKLVFIDDDVQAGARLPDGILKTISEAKEVTGENKFKPSFNFVARAVPILLCNNVPSLPDVSHGMLRRLMVIPFNRTFTANDRDPGLFDRIWANELPGVLNRALRGYARLLDRGRFQDPKAIVAAKASWLAQANPLPAFIEARCDVKPGAKSWVQELYRAYQDWARGAGYTLTQNQTTFRRNLEHLHYTVIHGNRGQRALGLGLRQQS